MTSRKYSVIILGAGRSQNNEDHSALRETAQGSRVLDWLIQAYSEIEAGFQFVGGYKLDEIEKHYPGFLYIENKNWRNTGATGSLFQAEIPQEGDLLVSYSDILYRKDIIKKVLTNKGDVVVAIDSAWKDRFRGRLQEALESCEKVTFAKDKITRLGAELDVELANGEFIGLVKFGENILPELKKLTNLSSEYLLKSNLSGLLEWLRLKGKEIHLIDVEGDWAELDDPRDLAHFVLGTKAQTLERLSGLVTKSKILDQVDFKVEDWDSYQQAIIQKIQNAFPKTKLVVRSSAISEDGFRTANAGVYESILNVNSNDKIELKEAIIKVIASYTDGNKKNQVLVQPMLTNVKASGVAFTRTLSHGAPYYVLNYDDQSGSTESITNGSSQSHKTLLVRRDALDSVKESPKYLRNLVYSIKELENLVQYDTLDIEFAVDGKDLIYILQVRPIAVDHSEWDIRDTDLLEFINQAEQNFEQLEQPSPFVLGTSAIYGVMPDWNPAEIIGIKPGLLATSLYKLLILDETWAKQRFEYGYRDVRPQPLLTSFAGHPYIDVRASFNSFIPARLDHSLAEKLVNFYLLYLRNHPELHDKVEFEVVPTCFDLNFDKWKLRLSEEGNFSDAEINTLRDALLEITQNAIKRNDQDFQKIKILEDRYRKIKQASLPPLKKAYLLLHDCKKYGTLPFAHLARSAFVAVSLLKSAVTAQVITKAEMEDFLNTIKTISHEFAQDAAATGNGELAWCDFKNKYGHVRPGTYDITSKSYLEDSERYLRPLAEKSTHTNTIEKKGGMLWKSVRMKFLASCSKQGITSNIEEVESFMRGAIEGREYAKFSFSRNLSTALDCIIEFGVNNDISRVDLSHISIENLFSAINSDLKKSDLMKWFNEMIVKGKKGKKICSVVELPPIICSKNDFRSFIYPETQANFIGSGQITASCIDLSNAKDIALDLNGKIVLIPQADPGYEWLFGQKLAGLITMYGGANSHMAIRAAEFGIPAAIGVGDTEYKRIASASILNLDAGNKKIDLIR
ncbi:MAG: hypothetical protein DHS20C18_24670 [Saprospiraceae bacterium]|nr:MAG: hypothetical protein DHS20C18_24670 [Saprospiraceae bacterium]